MVGRGPKSVCARIDQAVGKLDASRVKKLAQTPDDVKKLVEAKIADLEKIGGTLDTVTLTGWGQAKAQALVAMQTLEAQFAEAESELEAMLFLVNQVSKQRKAERNSDRYKKLKVASRLHLGGFGKNIGKRLSENIEAALNGRYGPAKVAHNPRSELDAQMVCMAGAVAEETGLKASLMQSSMESIGVKRASLMK